MTAQENFNRILDNSDAHTVEVLFELFDALPVVSSEFMLGAWKGGVFYSGHPGEQQLTALKWVGKNFTSENDVNPIVVADEAGQRQVSEVMGQACLREIRHRGFVTACMIYDTSPTIDYFRQVDDDTVMGVMDHKGDLQPLFFYLQRV